MTHHRPSRARRMAAALVAAGAVAALTPAAALAPASAAAPKDSVVTSVKGLPAKVQRGDSFTLRVQMRNPSRTAASRATNVSARLSRDARLSANDMAVGYALAPALRKGASGTTRMRISVPEWATSRYKLIVCTAKACTVAGTLRFPPPIRDLDGTLTGDLTFTDTGHESEPGHTTEWDHTQTVSVDLAMAGRDVTSTEIESSMSTWTYSGTSKEVTTDPWCTDTTRESRDGSGTLEWEASPGTDDIWASIGDFDLRSMSLGVRTHFGAVHRETRTGRDCASDDTRTWEGSDISSLDLVEVARTPSSRTYKVESWTAEYTTPSDWDEVEGTLILSLDKAYQS